MRTRGGLADGRWARGVLAGGLFTAVALLPAAASAATVKVTVPSGTQRALVSDRAVRVAVRSNGVATVRLSATTAHGNSIAKTATVAFRKRGSRTVRLRLTTAGRRTVGICGAPRVAVRARVRDRVPKGHGKKGTKNRTRTLSAKRTFTKDAGRCPWTMPGYKPGPVAAVPPPTATTTTPAPPPVETLHISVPDADHCDPIDPANCMLPFPNDYFTVVDSSTATGRRVAFDTDSLPANRVGVHLDATEYNRNDGFSPNNTILTRVPGIDDPATLTANGIVTQDDIGAYTRPDQPIVLIDATTGARVPIWTELEMVAGGPTDASGDKNHRLLIIHPAVALDYGRRYVVALRHLVDGSGSPIAPNDVFRAYRDGITTDNAAVEARRPAMDRNFQDLAGAGIERSDLYLAWDFTVASEQIITGRLRSIRDQAFAGLGDSDLANGIVEGHAPTIDNVVVHPYSLCSSDSNPACNGNESDYDVARITGSIEVPCFMDAPTDPDLEDHTPCAPGSRLHYTGGSSTPSQNGSLAMSAPFTCLLPRAAARSTTKAVGKRGVVFGHGLLGDHTQTEELRKFPAALDAVACGTSWAGMSSDDLATFLPLMLVDLGKFPALADRSQQGMLNVLFLARAMAASAGQGGFAGLPEFAGEGQSALDPHGKVGYLGISQGGIFGGAATSVAPDWDRAVLGVPAMGFSTLLTRSTQFNRFLPLVYLMYPNGLERTIGISMLQMLWDRGETGGYVHRVVGDPFPNTRRHKVVLLEAFGDHQVTNVQTETEARTIGAVLRAPTIATGRSPLSVPFWGIPTAPSSTFTQPGGYDGDASLFVLDTGPVRYDSALHEYVGTNANPLINVAPFEATGSQANDGLDPHEPVATSPAAQAILGPFLMDASGVTDPCVDAGVPEPCAAPAVHTVGEGL